MSQNTKNECDNNSVNVSVFCSSKLGKYEYFEQDIIDLGKMLCQNNKNVSLVYGGGVDGLMGKLADVFVDNSKTIIGIVPEIFTRICRERIHSKLTQVVAVNTLEERKKKLVEMSEIIIIFPGGVGTLEEALYAISEKQLGIHKKRIIIVNIKNFWQPLISQLSLIEDVQFGYCSNTSLYEVVNEINEITI